MGHEYNVSGMGRALHGTLVYWSLSILLGVFFPVLYDPLADRKRQCHLVTVLGRKDSRRWLSRGIKDPSFATPDACIPGVGCVRVDVKDTPRALGPHDDPCVIGSLLLTEVLKHVVSEFLRRIPVGAAFVEFREKIVSPFLVRRECGSIKEVQWGFFQILCRYGVVPIGLQAEVSWEGSGPTRASVRLFYIFLCQIVPILPFVDSSPVGGSRYHDRLVPVFVFRKELGRGQVVNTYRVHLFVIIMRRLCRCFLFLEPQRRQSKASAQMRSIDIIRVHVWYSHRLVGSKCGGVAVAVFVAVFVVAAAVVRVFVVVVVGVVVGGVEHEHVCIFPGGSDLGYDLFFGIALSQYLIPPQFGLVASNV
mmetsp:Transcript_28595/g.67159  ORF Transcript_28595/g.67159 Transcript_28595/m.67159 type:complete len:363 (-) Transcript_28595:140-1228(-)